MLKLPKGFQTYSLSAGIKYSNRNDLGVIFSQTPASYAGVFTSNRIYAAPVRLCRERMGNPIQAVVVNSGNANACTGLKGYEDARLIAEKAERVFNAAAENTALSLSTGVIGVPLPVEKILSALDGYEKADRDPESFARTIMTTDSFPKYASREVEIKGKKVTLTGFAKGAGMISPNMATMLSFILTDAQIDFAHLQQMLLECTGETFNAITVDGDMSTNDSVILLANGESGVSVQAGGESKEFKKALMEIMEELAKKIVQDGEGATKLIEIRVEKAGSREDARKVGLAIANSLLVKTAFFGNDPNWGRILAAAGYSGALVEEEKTELYFLDRWIFKGKPESYDRKELIEKMKDSKELLIRVVLNQGSEDKRFFTCDLSYDYVKINAEYTT
jgi:glutamate N-acetyltransferase/amino-acid N-acetyltransferase